MDASPDRLVEALRRDGLRITRARRAVCEVIAGAHDRHLTAGDIHDLAAAAGPIDQSTVYRTLDALGDAGLVTHTHMGHGPSVYHLAGRAAHQHLVCARCGATIDIDQAGIEALLAEITRRTGFVPDPTHFALSGLCRDCVAKS
jgi:Fur family ferric uptake transcriptional regulator